MSRISTLWVVPEGEVVAVPFDAQYQNAVAIELSEEFVAGFEFSGDQELWPAFVAYAAPVIPAGYKAIQFVWSIEPDALEKF